MDYLKLEEPDRSLDYCAIGKRIRFYRKNKGYTQEKLAELVDISTTHMSHIETGSTKLSLECFATLSEALEVKADDLLHDQEETQEDIRAEIIELLENSPVKRLRVYYDMLTALDLSLTRNMTPPAFSGQNCNNRSAP